MSAPVLQYHRPEARTPIRERSLAVRLLAGGLIVLAWLAVSAALLLIALGIARSLGPFSVLPAFLTLLLAIMPLPYARRAIRRRRAMALLGYLEQAVRLNLPLPQMLDAARRSETGRLAAHLDDLRTTLQAGVPLSMALGRIPELPGRILRLLAAAEHAGRVPAMLRRLIDEENRLHGGDDWRNRIFVSLYIMAYPITCVMVMTVAMVYLLPRLGIIFRDFKLPLPEVTRWAIWLANSEMVVAIATVLVLIWMLWIGARLWELFIPRSIVGPWSALEWLAWRTPVLGRLIRDRGLADIFHVLSEMTRAGHPLPAALIEVNGLQLNYVQAKQVQRWHEAVAAGTSMGDAARSAGLPALAVGLLGSGQRGGALPDALAFLSTYYAERFSRVIVLLQSALIPAMTLLFGAIVLFIAASVLLPLNRLVEMLSGVGRMV